ncbi:hypothetical protein PINS_up006370 [Pythium insidiosum]|nr:hypothetical protein PINS_up006370 [Pythium insidiosum]
MSEGGSPLRRRPRVDMHDNDAAPDAVATSEGNDGATAASGDVDDAEPTRKRVRVDDEPSDHPPADAAPQTPPPARLSLDVGSANGIDLDPSKRDPTAPDAKLPESDGEQLLIRHAFPFLTDRTRLLTPVHHDASGVGWRVVWLPHGQYLDDDHVSVFVEMVPSREDACETRHVRLELRLVHSVDPRQHQVERSDVITFAPENREFGVEKFISRARVATDFRHDLATNDGLLQLEVRLQFVSSDAVRPLSLGTPTALAPCALPMELGYDSKQETGMVGLKNQGATCYMNSLLQTLFHLRAFRRVVYDTPTEQEDTNDSVSLALQRVFYRLQTQSRAVSTKELTRSFGWSQMDAFMQHDVQELYRILCDRLEEKMKHTAVDNTIKRLFEGKVRSFVQCVNVDFQSFRDESYYDLQLDVKGCKDIYASFRKYVEIEMLEGENKYDAEGHGKQDAKKGVRFLSFPPVLNIQLKRFEYDPMRDGMVKIHDRFEFPTTLQLDEFAPTPADGAAALQQSLTYHLHSVLVHSGDVHGGHYYVFIRPGKQIAGSTDWFKFDDDQITRVDELTAVQGSYGASPSNGRTRDGSGPTTPLYSSALSPDVDGASTGNGASLDFRTLNGTPEPESRVEEVYDLTSPPRERGDGTPTSSGGLMMPLGSSFSSAYMLVYVRDGDNDIRSIQDPENGTNDVAMPEQVTDDTTDDTDDVAIPEPLIRRFHEEEKATARRKKLQQTEHLYMTFRIATDSSIAKLKKVTKTVDFSTFNNAGCLRIRIKRAASIRTLYHRLFERTGVPVRQQRLWKVITRENRTHRPDIPVPRDQLDARVDSLIDDDVSSKTPVRLFLQIVSDDEPVKMLNRHFWETFTPPEQGKNPEAATVDNEVEVDADAEVDIEDDDTKEPVRVEDPALDVNPHEILLFVKFYDLKRKLGERLEYVGNLLIDARKTGADLAQAIHDAMDIPSSKELILYEEIQPVSVQEIEMGTSLETAEIQNGDIVCYQLDEDEENAQQTTRKERYPDVPSYFQYLLDRVDVTFHRYGHPDEEPLVLHLLFSHCYDDLVDAVAARLGLGADKRLYVRLFQHSPLSGLPKKTPLRHSKYAGDTKTTLEEFLTEYSERTNVMYYELLSHPITEIEAKKQVLVYFSIYDACFVDPSSPKISRRFEYLVAPTATVGDLIVQVRQSFQLDASAPLRVCEVTHNGALMQGILYEDTTLEKYWVPSSGYVTVNDAALFVERIPDEELALNTTSSQQLQRTSQESEELDDTDQDDSSEPNRVFRMAVVHFNFQPASQLWIHPHGVPFVTFFREQDTVRQVRERMRRRLGAAEDVFAQWNMAFVKDIKASTLSDLYDDMEADVLEEYPMQRFEEICGDRFENVTGIGLEHADARAASAKQGVRRQEHGIRIRQS